MKRQVASTIIINNENKILILQRGEDSSWAGRWNFPGGKVEDNGESLEEAAARETKEETNLDINPKTINKIGSIEHKTFIITFFITREYSGNVNINKESQLYEWVSLEELKERSFPMDGKINPKLYRAIKNFIEG